MMARARHHAMNAAAGEFGRAGAAVACGQHAVGVAVQRYRRHGDRRQRRQPALQTRIAVVAGRKAKAKPPEDERITTAP